MNDFPKLVTLLEGKSATSAVNNGLEEALANIENEVVKTRNNMVTSDEFMKKVSMFISRFKTTVSILEQQRDTQKKNLEANFNSVTKVVLPEISNPFIDLRTYNRLKIKYKDKTEVLETKSIIEQQEKIDTLASEFKAFQEAHPEHFI